MKHDPATDFRSGRVRDAQAMRELDGYAWAPRPRFSVLDIISVGAVIAFLVLLIVGVL